MLYVGARHDADVYLRRRAGQDGNKARRSQVADGYRHGFIEGVGDHVNRVAPEPLPFGWGVIFPGYSDELALERGLLATDLPLAEARARFRVDERARAALADGAADFSARIRSGA